MTPEQRETIEKYGIITLCQEINQDTAEYVMQAFLLARSEGRSGDPIALYISSYGGDVAAGVAITSLILADGNVDGVLLGDTFSCASWIWAACQRRFISPIASMGIHTPGHVRYNERREDSTDARLRVKELEDIENFVSGIYASASRMPADWWKQMMHQAGSYHIYVKSDELVGALGMAQWWAEREASWDGTALTKVRDHRGVTRQDVEEIAEEGFLDIIAAASKPRG